MRTNRAGIAVLALVAVAGIGAGCSGSGTASGPGATGSPSSPASRLAGSPAASATGSALSPSDTLLPNLDTYTDRGDGCAQAISAIGYADESLRPLGQEPYQEFDDLVRSKLSAVSGTLALEADDFPNRAVARQAQVVQILATKAAALTPDEPKAQRARVRALLRYRIEAAELVLLCRDADPPEPPDAGSAPSPMGGPRTTGLPATRGRA
jgi:hypothetical protein